MMPPLPTRTPRLAPVQAAMLRAREPGTEVEQVMLVFRPGLTAGQVVEAWAATVAASAALGHALSDDGLVPVRPGEATRLADEPACFEAWLEEDRTTPFPRAGEPPWRVRYWPAARRWVWSFPHALLDGRSIARILRGFLWRLEGRAGGELPLAEWQPADEAERQAAAAHFLKCHQGVAAARVDFGESGRVRVAATLGAAVAGALEAAAAASGTSAATIVTWAWGQVLARATGVEALALGQVRAGRPAGERAGFSMNTLPLVVRRMRQGRAADGWRELRREILALRAFERVAVAELPAEIFAPGGVPWSAVIMVERGSLGQLLGDDGSRWLESVELRERPAGPLTASAYLRPDLCLELETTYGRRAAESLLGHWATGPLGGGAAGGGGGAGGRRGGDHPLAGAGRSGAGGLGRRRRGLGRTGSSGRGLARGTGGPCRRNGAVAAGALLDLRGNGPAGGPGGGPAGRGGRAGRRHGGGDERPPPPVAARVAGDRLPRRDLPAARPADPAVAAALDGRGWRAGGAALR